PRSWPRGDRDYKSATRDVARLLGELKQDKVDGVLIDLRNNGGGSLTEATELTGLFIDQGPVVQVRNAQGRVESEQDGNAGMSWDGPLAVLVNRGSASASEIFAAAIQDYGRGLIIGEPTFGKGTVQMLVDLDNAAQNEKPKYGELKMTSAQFFRINGGTTQLRGVVPDIAFPDAGEAKEFGESSYPNALPWSSITPASYDAVADLKPVLPMLTTRHEARIAKSQEWAYYAEDQSEVKRLRAEKTVSLNETTRRKERDDQEARKKTRDAERAALEQAQKDNPSLASTTVTRISEGTAAEDGDDEAATAASDDGLQADERSIKSQVEREKQAKQRKDVPLEEAAHILADEVGLIRADTKLAQQVLPQQQPPGRISVD
ncbi:MAG TPA: carboxy terminal-processing peptidase, partial [Tahibacter sp.]|nr:carboxy terminal-processing peptidase [Tahibacter sp.]